MKNDGGNVFFPSLLPAHLQTAYRDAHSHVSKKKYYTEEKIETICYRRNRQKFLRESIASFIFLVPCHYCCYRLPFMVCVHGRHKWVEWMRRLDKVADSAAIRHFFTSFDNLFNLMDVFLSSELSANDISPPTPFVCLTFRIKCLFSAEKTSRESLNGDVNKLEWEKFSVENLRPFSWLIKLNNILNLSTPPVASFPIC